MSEAAGAVIAAARDDGGEEALVRVRAMVADGAAARATAELLADGDGTLESALATSQFEDPESRKWLVDAYFGAAPPVAELLLRIGHLLAPGTAPSIEAVPDENWVAISQAALPPVTAGRFVVHGSHDRDRVGRRQNAIEIDAGEAFGTAHHATTEGCLLAIDRLARRRGAPAAVLDLGCGTGVLAIAAARVWPRARIAASDLDPVAVEVAGGNIRRNGAGSRVRARVAAGLAHADSRRARSWDVVLANILAGPLIWLAPALARVVRPGGAVVLSGILGEQARSVEGAYRMAGFRLARRHVNHNWVTLEMTRNGRGARETQRPARRVPAARSLRVQSGR